MRGEGRDEGQWAFVVTGPARERRVPVISLVRAERCKYWRDGRDKPGHDARKEETMTQRTKPPFRADHVGSLLRPAALKTAREERAKGEIGAAELKAVEDRDF
jgi:hypothetical protein